MTLVSILSTLIGLLIALGGCQSQSHGLLTLVEPVYYEATVDFSGLAAGESAQSGHFEEPDSDEEPDLIFKVDVLEAPYGIQAIDGFSFDDPSDELSALEACAYTTSPPVDCLDTYVKLFEDHPPQFEEGAFQTSIPQLFIFWPLLIVRTAEGDQVALLHVGTYIGALNREYFFWTYLDN